MTIVLNGDTGITSPGGDTQAADTTINGLTVGRGAGAVATNTAVGASALAANTTGIDNSGFGYFALQANTSGTYNTALGRTSLYTNTTGSANSALGRSALENNTTGGNNSAVGYGALFSNTTASNNTAVGHQAAYANTTGTAINAFGYQALYSNTTGVANSAFGGFQTAVINAPLYSNTTGGYNSAFASGALVSNTTGSNNSGFGYGALANNTTGSNSTAVGFQAGYSNTVESSTYVGYRAGANTTGTLNAFFGFDCGINVTSGTRNTIIGGYNGNQGGLDIRTSSNYIVLSDGDGNPRIYNDSGKTVLVHNAAIGTGIVLTWSGDFYAYPCDQGSFNAAQAGIKIQKIGSTNRSLNAAGTINASGADYAEYMTKSSLDFTVAKGDVVGINAEGKLTNVFADAISFVVKSTDPAYVGGDSWGAKSQDKDGPQYTEEELEVQRQMVDRIAFSGQVPVNVTGATAGQYIIPVNDNGAIKGEAVSSPTFEQYQQAVGKVIAIESDGRARIIVKVA